MPKLSARARWLMPLALVLAVIGAPGHARGKDAGPRPVAVDAAPAVAPGDAAPVLAPFDAAPAPSDAAPAPAPSDAAPALAPNGAAPALAPSDAAPAPSAARPPPVVESHADRAGLVIKVILGLVVLLSLAYVGGHPRIQRLEQRVGIAHVVTAGFPFIGLGLLASHPAVGILSREILVSLLPILHFGLGWLGFILGTQFDVRFLDRLPRGTAFTVVVEASAPFALIAISCGGLMLAFGHSWDDAGFVRDALVLGAAGAMTAPRHGVTLSSRLLGRGGEGMLDSLVGQLDEIAGVIGLLFLAAFFRPEAGVGWQLPGTAWLLVTLGLGVAIGVLVYVMIRGPRTSAEFLAVLLGSIAFASGLAGYLHLSPIVVCFIAGALVTNFPCDQRADITRILSLMERPIHLVFLIIAGAVWSVGDWRGWVLLPCFVAARLVGKWLGVRGSERAARSFDGHDLPHEHRVIIAPLSVLSIAIVVSVQSLYPEGSAIPWIMTAVIGGAIVTEILVQASQAPPGARPARASVVDDDYQPRLRTAGRARRVPDDHDDDGPRYVDPDDVPAPRTADDDEEPR